jgi:hypothetical protein
MKCRYRIATDMGVELLATLPSASHEAVLELTFNVTPDQSATHLQPGEGATVHIITAQIVENYGTGNAKRHDAPDWLWAMIEDDDALEREMLAEAWEADEAAREQWADMAREERLLERDQ